MHNVKRYKCDLMCVRSSRIGKKMTNGIWILTSSAIGAVDQSLIGSSGLRNVSRTVGQRVVIGDLADARSILMAVVVIIVSHLLVVAGCHLLRMSCISFRSIVRTLTHSVLLVIVVHAIAINAISNSGLIRSRIVLILIIILLLKLLLHCSAGRDPTSWNRCAQHYVIAHHLRRAVSVRVGGAVVCRGLMVLRIIVDQVALWDRCGSRHGVLILLAIIVDMICSIDWRIWWCGWRRSLFRR